MADSPVSDVGIFDDFEDAKKMSFSVCQQVPMTEYEEAISSETDKALGDLCLYLDQHPEIYARILRKRKQEEMESGGVVSFVKSKMMKLVHGEEYPECLLSMSECFQQTNSLKAGLCKTFQYSQEIKGTPNRYSKRLAAKQNALVTKHAPEKSAPVTPAFKSVDRSGTGSMVDSFNMSRLKGKAASSLKTESSFDSLNTNPTPSSSTTTANTSSSNTNTYTQEEGSSKARPTSPSTANIHPLPENKEMSQNDKFTGLEEKDEKTSGKSCPSPPTPPPLPPIPAVQASGLWSVPRKTLSSLALNLEDHNQSPRRKSPRVGKGGDHARNRRTCKEGLDVLKSSSSNSLHRKESPFLTSMGLRERKTHKRSVSPGGTPVRPNLTDRLPSEPLHKALVTAMKSKFKNVYTPSPGSKNVSLNSSTASNRSGN